ncbi:class I SAM-dependent methyltransferase [Myxococcota bacterium]|nr:class I SAM-dependent methyltransferase [Myxococcota bacterium]
MSRAVAEGYREFYEQKVDTYLEKDRAARIRYEHALDHAALAPDAEILDLACRDAVMLQVLPEERRRHYTGVDISERVIAKNRERFPGVRFELGDIVAGLPFPDRSFDRVFALEILEHVPEPLRLLQEAARVLKDDGRLILSVPNPYYYMELVNELRGFPDTEGHIFAYPTASLNALLALAGLESEGVRGTYFEIPKKLRGAFRDQATWFVRKVPVLLARSRIHRIKKR